MSNEQTILENLKEETKKLQNLYGTHGFEHSERVFETCKFLGSSLGADMSVLLPAALLHDIGRMKDNHANAGAKITGSILRKYGFGTQHIKKIKDAIKSHSFTAKDPPNTLEAKILSDADKIDALGALGIYRAATYSGENPRSIIDFIKHFHEKLLKLNELLYTEEAKNIAEDRKKFMLNYLNQLNKEIYDQK
jgi:uncharacterized protein